MLVIKARWYAACSIHEAITDAYALSDRTGASVEVEFNGVSFATHPSKGPTLTFLEWRQKMDTLVRANAETLDASTESEGSANI